MITVVALTLSFSVCLGLHAYNLAAVVAFVGLFAYLDDIVRKL